MHGDVVEEKGVAFDGDFAGDLLGFEIVFLQACDAKLAAAGHDGAVLMGKIEVKLSGDGAGNFWRRRDERIGLMQGEIFNGEVEMSEVFGEVVGGGQGPVTIEELELF